MNGDFHTEEEILGQVRSLVAEHTRTRVWFWRTGVAALVSAAIWIIGFVLLPSTADLKQRIALTASGLIMWILFAIAFRLQIRLSHIVKRVQGLEQQLLDAKRHRP